MKYTERTERNVRAIGSSYDVAMKTAWLAKENAQRIRMGTRTIRHTCYHWARFVPNIGSDYLLLSSPYTLPM
jgi:hypothetical protein